MKKILFFFIFFFFPFIYVSAIEVNNSDNGNDSELASNAKSAIMIEASTGKILYEKNSRENLPMASMTKMMTMLLIMESIDNGSISLNDKVVASNYAASMGGSQIFLTAGEEMSVSDMLKGIAIGSGNDAAVAMAEKIGGSEEEFVKMMNKKARDMGLKNTNFVNACGLDDENDYSSGYDMVMIARELIKHEKILEYTGTYEEYLRKDSENPFWLVNTNKLVRYYSGVDGLKTGYTETAGYCITTTASRNGMRLITVVMGEPTSQIRNAETTKMLDYGFNTYKISNVLSTNTVLTRKYVDMGKNKYVEIIPVDDVNVLDKKTDNKKNYKYKFKINNLRAPLKTGDVVGKISVIENGKVLYDVDATVKENVKKANIFIVYLRNLIDIIKGTA